MRMGNFKIFVKVLSLLPIRNTRTAFSRLTEGNALKCSLRHKVLNIRNISSFKLEYLKKRAFLEISEN
jgi:hypothetical protein